MNRPIITENKLVVVRGDGAGGWAKWVKGKWEYWLPAVECRCHGDERYSTGISSGAL